MLWLNINMVLCVPGFESIQPGYNLEYSAAREISFADFNLLGIVFMRGDVSVSMEEMQSGDESFHFFGLPHKKQAKCCAARHQNVAV